MASGKCTYLANKILDQILGGTAYSTPATFWIALFTASPGASASLSAEVSGGSYARVAVPQNTTNWPNSSGGSKSNGADFTFPTATGNWGTVTSFMIVDSSSGACNGIYFGDLTVSKVISTGDTAKFASGDLTVTES